MLTPPPGPTLDESLEFLSRFIAWAYARGRRPDEKSMSDYHPRT